jgi:hypothetical protein
MKRALLAGLVGLSCLASAQSVRSLGMSGLILPGPDAAYLNPAYAAFPASLYGSRANFPLPIGLVALLLRPQTSPFGNLSSENSPFDLLSAYDQFTHPNEFLLNPASSDAFINPATGYPEIVINVDGNGVRVTDSSGRPINLNFSVGRPAGVSSNKALTPEPLFRLPIPLGPGLSADLGIFAGGVGLGISPDANLQQAVASGTLKPDTDYNLSASASAQAGISLGLSYASVIPRVPLFESTVSDLYVGARGEGFYGLGYLEGTATARIHTDANAQPSSAAYSGKVFFTHPGNGSGIGLRADLGVALKGQGTTVGLGIRNALGFAHWSGTEITYSENGQTSTGASERSGFGVAPALFLNAASKLPLEIGSVIVGGDLGLGGSLYTHLGAEYQLGELRLRAGLGYNGGFILGLGAGYAGDGFSLDAALTTHPAPIVGGTVYGIAVGLGVSY